MKSSPRHDLSIAVEPFWRRWANAWSRFWFTPADPTVLGMIRVCCGVVTLYIIFAYSFSLQEFMGENGWYDLKTRLNDVARNRPNQVFSLDGYEGPAPGQPESPEQRAFQDRTNYQEQYRKTFGDLPPPPFPENAQQADFSFNYRREFGVDFRFFGLPFPKNKREEDYLLSYTREWFVPPPAFPASAAEEKAINDYMRKHSEPGNPVDPRRLYAKGSPVWSLWFHVTDPAAMAWVHGAIIGVIFLFTIGFATRLTSILTWMTSLWYIHRTPTVLFGMDTMMTILLTYLMIGPSGAAVSVDRLLARWWRRAKPLFVNRWRSWFGKPPLTEEQLWLAPYDAQPQPSIGANFAIRCLQIHVCIIYFIAGLSKLQGTAWWNGTAVWNTVANFEFAPMQIELYTEVLRILGQNQFLFELFFTGAGLFTLAFEICYIFLVWRPATRWWLLTGAILLHGFIGMFMGLKTFSLLMLVMNMSFLTPAEGRWLLSWFSTRPKAPVKSPAHRPTETATKPVRPALDSTAASAHVTVKK